MQRVIAYSPVLTDVQPDAVWPHLRLRPLEKRAKDSSTLLAIKAAMLIWFHVQHLRFPTHPLLNKTDVRENNNNKKMCIAAPPSLPLER